MAQATDSLTASPKGELAIRVLAMPANTNQNGDIFGGWLLGQMDIGGDITVSRLSRSRCVTVSVDEMSFKKPVCIGDVVCIYVEVLRIGHTSAAVGIEAWVIRRNEDDPLPVAQGRFTYVAIDDDGKPRAIAPQAAAR